MPSFQITITPSRRAAALFVGDVRRGIQRALAEAKAQRGVTQSAVANALGVHRSIISREVAGRRDLSLSRVAEIAWAIGLQPKLVFVPATAPGHNGQPHAAAINLRAATATTAGVNTVRPIRIEEARAA